jgi:hypothetical protein
MLISIQLVSYSSEGIVILNANNLKAVMGCAVNEGNRTNIRDVDSQGRSGKARGSEGLSL